MPAQPISLEIIDIAKPCPADWNAMRGDEQVRFCKHCSLNVYNLSAMSRADAEKLVGEREGRLCVRFYRRLDGTVITRDCGGGWKLAARRFGRFATAATAVVLTAALAPLGLTRWAGASPTDSPNDAVRCEAKPIQQAAQILGQVRNTAVMGDFAAPPLMGAPLPPPPATQPATQPAATQPVKPE